MVESVEPARRDVCDVDDVLLTKKGERPRGNTMMMRRRRDGTKGNGAVKRRRKKKAKNTTLSSKHSLKKLDSPI